MQGRAWTGTDFLGYVSGAMLGLFTVTVFVSAFLLFAVQPMFARMLLPLLGGAPAVWNTAMVFYQGALLLGYGYAHLACRRLGVRRQSLLHLGIMAAGCLVLPVALPEGWVPPAESSPVPWLLSAMTVSIGLPFFVVSAGAPLLQRWFAATSHPHAKDPYFLYAASNVGSLLALLAYPVAVEPRLRLFEQSWAWTGLYGLLLGLVAGCAWRVWRDPVWHASDGIGGGAPAIEPVPWRRRGRWIALAFVPSSLMLSVTQYLTTDLAAAPLLWIVPLSIYLGTFVLVFARRPRVSPSLVRKAAPMAIVAVSLPLALRGTDPLPVVISFHLGTFFVIAMACHGELASSRPPAVQLTAFYLCMAVGGVLGGAFNSLVAPWLFNDLWEYPLVLCLACLMLRWPEAPRSTSRRRLLDVALPAALGVLMVGLVAQLQSGALIPSPYNNLAMFGVPAILCYSFSRRPVRMGLGLAAFFAAAGLYQGGVGQVVGVERSFFGVTKVTLSADGRYRQVLHGNTVHGRQHVDPERRGEPLAYFGRSGPLGRFLGRVMDVYAIRRVGVVGLGAGVISAYARSDQEWSYYEIDPVVIRVAKDPAYFSFLRDCAAPLRIIPGDARRSLAAGRPGQYDLLILDAYSSDAAPVHLLTREALALYLHVLAEDGFLVFQISNRYLDLESVVAALAADAGVACRVWAHVPSPAEQEQGLLDSKYAFLARDAERLEAALPPGGWRRAEVRRPGPVWTDDYASLLQILNWSPSVDAMAAHAAGVRRPWVTRPTPTTGSPTTGRHSHRSSAASASSR